MPATASIITPAVSQAVHKFLPKEPIEPGKFSVRGKLRLAIDCHLTKGEPTTRRTTFKPEWERVIAAIFWLLEVPCDRAAVILQDAILETVSDELMSDEHVDHISGALAKVIEERTATLAPSIADGGLRGDGKVEVIDFKADGGWPRSGR